MSNAARLATILKKLGDAHYQAADELIALAEQPQAASPAAAPVAGGASPAPDTRPELPPRQEPAGDQGSLARCPRHGADYREGNYGPFCSKKAEGAWSKNGFCSITPKNVADYLRQQAVVTA